MIRLALLAVGLVELSACTYGCGNSVVSRIVAPDGAHSAVLFQRDCGATTGFSTQISVLAEGEELSGSGNAFIVDDSDGYAAAGEWGGPWAEMEWAENGDLSVRYADGSHVIKKSERVSGVGISYEEIDR